MAEENSEVNNFEEREQLGLNNTNSIAQSKEEEKEYKQKFIEWLRKENDEQLSKIKILEQKLECQAQNENENIKEQKHGTIQSNVKYSTNVSEKCLAEVVRKENSKESQDRPFNRYQQRFKNNRNDRIKIVNENKFRKILNIRELLKGTYTVFKFDRIGRKRFQVRDRKTHENVTNFIAYLKYRFHLWLKKNCSSAEDCICTNCRHAKILNCSNPALCQRNECIWRRRQLAKSERQSLHFENEFVARKKNSGDISAGETDGREAIDQDENEIIVPQTPHKQTTLNLTNTPENRKYETYLNDSGICLNDSFLEKSDSPEPTEQKRAQSQSNHKFKDKQSYNPIQRGMMNVFEKYTDRYSEGAEESVDQILWEQSTNSLVATASTPKKIKLSLRRNKSVLLKPHYFMKAGDKVRIKKNSEYNQELGVNEEIKEIDVNGRIEVNLKNNSDGPMVIKRNERIAILQLIEDN